MLPIVKKCKDIITGAYGVDMQHIIALRREIHQNPEGGYQEYKTRERIINYLLTHGAKESMLHKIATTGLTCTIQGTNSTPSLQPNNIAFRCDIDALKTNECNEHLEYRSTNGFAHMCGHDGHISMVLTAADVFLKNAHKIPNNCSIKLLFQPAEESLGGAENMIKEGALDGVNEVYGLHIYPKVPIGKIGITKDYMSTAVKHIVIKINGKSTHGTTPELGLDPIGVAAHIRTGISNLMHMGLSKKEFCICTICMIHAGSADNVIPDYCEMRGTIRTFEEEVEKKAADMLDMLVENTCKSYGCNGKIEYVAGYPSIKNNPKCAEYVMNEVNSMLGSEAVTTENTPFYASEDFAFYTRKIPGAFLFLGSQEQKEQPYLHSSNFTFNEDIIPIGGLLWVRLAASRLGISI